MRQYPHIPVRAYGHYAQQKYDLEFLRFYPELMEFQFDIYYLEDCSGLRYLPGTLNFLGIGATRKRHSLAELRRFQKLKNLFLDGHTKDFEAVSSLVQLDWLSLRSITLPDLSPLLPLEALRSLDMKLGGTRNLSLLPNVGRVQYLEFWLIKGLADLNAVASMPCLQYLFLQALKNVTQLPPFARLTELKRVHIETLKGLGDLSPVAAAPALEELVVADMRHLRPESFEPFVGHSRLRAATIGLGSLRKNAAAERLVGLPHVKDMFAKGPISPASSNDQGPPASASVEPPGS